MNDKLLSLLGIARRAGKLALGHDAVKELLNAGKVKLVIFTCDASERLKGELGTAAENKKIPVIYTQYTMNDIHCAAGSKAAVTAVADSGFAKRLTELFEDRHKEV